MSWEASGNFSAHVSGGKESKIKVLAGLTPSGGSEGESVLSCLSPGLWGSWYSLGHRLIVPISAPLISKFASYFCKDTIHWIRALLSPVGPH